MAKPLEEADACFADKLLVLDFTSDTCHPPVAACFADELRLLDFTSDTCHAPVAAAVVAGESQHQALFDLSVDGLPDLPTEGGGGGDDGEEELEWLADKNVFPPLETSFEIPDHSLSSSDEGSASTGGGTAGERPTPVSDLAAAASFSAQKRPRSTGRRRRMRRRSVLTGLSPEPAAMARAGRPGAAERRLRMLIGLSPEPTFMAGSWRPGAAERRWAPGLSPEPAAMAGAGRPGAAERRRCRHCQAEETPQWRAGPEGPKTLCNACGVRYKSGRLVPEYRPANSPTFSAALHSNSHRLIQEMRRQKAGH